MNNENSMNTLSTQINPYKFNRSKTRIPDIPRIIKLNNIRKVNIENMNKDNIDIKVDINKTITLIKGL